MKSQEKHVYLNIQYNSLITSMLGPGYCASYIRETLCTGSSHAIGICIRGGGGGGMNLRYMSIG